jgi:hypothetical protein
MQSNLITSAKYTCQMLTDDGKYHTLVSGQYLKPQTGRKEAPKPKIKEGL